MELSEQPRIALVTARSGGVELVMVSSLELALSAAGVMVLHATRCTLT